jgi:hypothetical protein
LLPLHLKREDKILLLEVFAAGDQFPASKISAHFQTYGVQAQTLVVSGDTVAASMERLLAAANEADLLVWNLFIGPTCYSGKIGMPAMLVGALRRLQELHKPTVAISFGDPYIYLSIPFVDAYLCAASDDLRSCQGRRGNCSKHKLKLVGKSSHHVDNTEHGSV